MPARIGERLRWVARRPVVVPMLLVGAVLSPLFLGVEPVGSDADFMYRPIKEELARGLRAGVIPFWVDRFGVGVPLVAESHMAAFYPPNWVLYRLLPVAPAYRLSIWLHYVAVAGLTYAYGRRLALTPEGSIAAALVLALGGFMAVHAVHEPLYTLMPYLPLCLLLADRYIETGRLVWMAALALAWGVQLTAGHFQVQMWTAGLVLFAGLWRISRGLPSSRFLGLLLGLAWGAAAAWIQLRLTWELTGVSEFSRGPQFLSNYLFPVSHWAQWALPAVYLGGTRVLPDAYWRVQRTTPDEACAYVGVAALILAFAGFVAGRGERRLAPWRWLIPLGFALATLPQWWPGGFALLVMVPGLGWFRAPARYTLLCNLGLALLAGRGLDRSIAPRTFRVGLGLALAFGVAGWTWTIALAKAAGASASLSAGTLFWSLAGSLASWVLALGTIVAWRRGWIGASGPLGVMALELGALFYLSSVHWGWSVGLPEESPVLRALRDQPSAELIAGKVDSLPDRAGLSPAYPSLGITAPRPNFLLEATRTPPGRLSPGELRWHRRLGVSHGIWAEEDDVRGTEVACDLVDPALDRLMRGQPGVAARGRWKLVRYPQPFPAAWLALSAEVVPGWGPLFQTLSASDHTAEAWFEHGQEPAETRTGPERPVTDFFLSNGDTRAIKVGFGVPAHSARILEWSGRRGIVEHDGTCYLMLRRAAYPGWSYRLDGGSRRPVLKADGDLQCIPIPVLEKEPSGLPRQTRVEVEYRPTGLAVAAVVSSLAALSALACLSLAFVPRTLMSRTESVSSSSKP